MLRRNMDNGWGIGLCNGVRRLGKVDLESGGIERLFAFHLASSAVTFDN